MKARITVHNLGTSIYPIWSLYDSIQKDFLEDGPFTTRKEAKVLARVYNLEHKRIPTLGAIKPTSNEQGGITLW